MREIKTLQQLKELAQEYTREDFIELMANETLYEEHKVYWFCPNSYSGLLKVNNCNGDDTECRECWRNATKDFVFKDDLEKKFQRREKEMKEPKYKVGDKVKIREDLKVGNGIPNYYSVITPMSEYRGKIDTIIYIDGDDNGNYSYKLANNDWYWTESMFEGLFIGYVDEAPFLQEQPKQQNKIVTFEDINIPIDCGYTLNWINKEDNDEHIRTNESKLLYFDSAEIKGSDITDLIKWLQDVNTYREQLLAEPEVEYVDFQTALAWMKESENKNTAKLDNKIYSYGCGNLWVDIEEDTSSKITTLTLPQIESKEWILIKEDK